MPQAASGAKEHVAQGVHARERLIEAGARDLHRVMLAAILGLDGEAYIPGDAF